MREHYYETPKQTLLSLLPNRSWPAIKTKSKLLKVKRSSKFWLMTIGKLWSDRDFLSNHNKVMKKLWSNPEHRNLMRIKTQKQWKNADYKRKFIRMVKSKWQDPDYRKKKIEEIKNRWKDPDYQRMMSEKTKKQWQNPQTLIKIREGLIRAKLNGSKEEKFIREYLRNKLKNTRFVVGDSTIDILRRYEIDIPIYLGNKPVMLIECDGIIFHGENALGQSTDEVKDRVAQELGYSINRIKYHSLWKEKESIIQQCDEVIKGLQVCNTT